MEGNMTSEFNQDKIDEIKTNYKIGLFVLQTFNRPAG
jgi:hypothetical protein